MLTKLNHDKRLAFKLADRQAGGWMEESDKKSSLELKPRIIFYDNLPTKSNMELYCTLVPCYSMNSENDCNAWKG